MNDDLVFKQGDVLVLTYQENEIREILLKLGYDVDDEGYVIDKGGRRIKSLEDPSKEVKVEDIRVIGPGSEAQIITSDEEYNIYLLEKLHM